ARNKIEFLADLMDKALADLGGQLGESGMPVKNYVRNPAFLDHASNSAQHTKFTGEPKPGAIQGNPHQNAGHFADGWNFEQGPPLDAAKSAGFSAHRNLHFPAFFTAIPFAANDIWVSANNCKGMIYQALHLPRRVAYFKAKALFAANADVTVTVGFQRGDVQGRLYSETSLTTTESIYETPPSTSYNMITLESQVYRVSGASNAPELVCFETESKPGDMATVMLLGMQVIETDKDGNPLEDGPVDMSSDGYGYTRFTEALSLVCLDTTAAGNQFEFELENAANVACPAGAFNHLTMNNLYFWQGVNGKASGNVSSGSLDNGVEMVSFDGTRLVVELSEANANTVRNCGGMRLYLRYSATPFNRGIYA
ncbi:hypothetical protein ABT56_22750, partial [Photobacterium aquae]